MLLKKTQQQTKKEAISQKARNGRQMAMTPAKRTTTKTVSLPS